MAKNSDRIRGRNCSSRSGPGGVAEDVDDDDDEDTDGEGECDLVEGSPADDDDEAAYPRGLTSPRRDGDAAMRRDCQRQSGKAE